MSAWVQHSVHCRDCGETWTDGYGECTCTCTGPGLETWVVTEVCASCGQPWSEHPAYLCGPEPQC